MPQLWIFLALASAVCLGLYDVAKKFAVEKNAPLLVLCVSSLAGFGCLLPLFVLSRTGGISSASSLFVRELSGSEHALVFLKAAIVSSSWVCSFFAIQHLPISTAGPIRACSPVLTIFGAMLLFSEQPQPRQWLALILILSGTIGMALLGRKEGIRFEANRAISLLVCGMILGAGSGLFDKFLLQNAAIPPTSLQFWFTADNLVLQTGFVAIFWWPRRERQPRFRFTSFALAVGVLLVIADQFYFRALAQEGAMISIVSLVRRSNVLISLSVGGLLLKENFLRQKGAVVFLILGGLLLLLL